MTVLGSPRRNTETAAEKAMMAMRVRLGSLLNTYTANNQVKILHDFFQTYSILLHMNEWMLQLLIEPHCSI